MTAQISLLRIPVPDHVLAPIQAYGDARATEEGAYDTAALKLADVITALRRWAMELQNGAYAPVDRKLLEAAFHALSSYAMGNAAPELAQSLAATLERHLGGVPEADDTTGANHGA